jgi:predicted DNA-binding helix-hairpin-helix protein
MNEAGIFGLCYVSSSTNEECGIILKIKLTNFTIDNCLIIAKARLSTSHI